MTLWREHVATRLGSVHDPVADKRTSLREAIERHVRPRMRLNPVSLQSRPVAALHELIRVFGGGECLAVEEERIDERSPGTASARMGDQSHRLIHDDQL